MRSHQAPDWTIAGAALQPTRLVSIGKFDRAISRRCIDRAYLLSLLCMVASLVLGLCTVSARAQSLPRNVTDHFFISSDDVRLHYLEAGPASANTLVFVPGWTMPAWIWMILPPLRAGRVR